MSFLKAYKQKLASKEVKKDDEPTCGVYYIRNVLDDKYYVGSSKNVERRIQTHKQHLDKGCHNCRTLQKDYDTTGLDNFEFNIIEKDISEDLLTAYEKYWIYKYNAIVMYKGYNEIFPTTNHKLFKKVYNLKESVTNE